MSKLTLSDVANISGNPTSAESTINNNSTLVEQALDNTLSRDGSTPNMMNADFDMNSHRILNVAIPIGNTDVATKEYADSLAIAAGSSYTAIGGVPRTLSSKLGDIVSVKDFGAVGDGVVNDTAAIQSTINAVRAAGGGTVYLPTGSYKITTITLYSNVSLLGAGSNKRGSLNVTTLYGTVGYNAVVIDPTNTADIGIHHLAIYGGNRCISYNPTVNNVALSNFELYDVCLRLPTNECIFIGGQAERLRFRYIYFANGTYGYYHGIGSTGRTFALFEKSTWEDCYFEGQSKNAVFYDTVNVSGSTTYNFTKVISCNEHAWRIKGNVGGLVFINAMFENTGLSGGTASTTGSITAGTNTLTVASGTGFSNGQAITVSGAGLLYGAYAGCDLETTISSGGGTTTLTLAANAAYTVSSAPVTNRKYDNFYFEQAVGLGFGENDNINFVGGYLNDGSAYSRYTINTNGTGYYTVIGSVGNNGGYDGKPINDPLGKVSLVNAMSGRRTSTFNTDPFSPYGTGGIQVLPLGQWTDATTEQPNTLIGTAPGKGVYVGLQGSNGNGTGTFDDFAVYALNANRERLLHLQSSNYSLGGKIKLRPGNYGADTGATVYDGTGFICYGNAIPTAGTWTQGSIVFNALPAVASAKGWVCTVSGTPGTWVSMGNL